MGIIANVFIVLALVFLLCCSLAMVVVAIHEVDGDSNEDGAKH